MTVSVNNTVIDLGILTDDYEPEISINTTASDKATGEKSIVASKSVTIVDKVALDGLSKGTKYQLKGWEMVKSKNAQLLVNGKPVENDYSFTAESSKMEVEIEFTFNASTLGGKELVIFEELYDLTNPDKPVRVTQHNNIENHKQTVLIIEKPKSPAAQETYTAPKPHVTLKLHAAPKPHTTPKEPGVPTNSHNSPKTGDSTPFAALLAITGISAAGLVFAGYRRLRRVKKPD